MGYNIVKQYVKYLEFNIKKEAPRAGGILTFWNASIKAKPKLSTQM